MNNKTNERITIQGTAPKFDEAVLKQRQAARHNQYHLTSESHAVARGTIAFEFLTNVIKLAGQGYDLSNNYPVTTDPMSYQAYMRKPDAIQQADLEALDAKMKLDYIADLELEREDYRVKLTAQLLQTAELKERKKEEEKRAKLLKEIEKEVNDAFGELVIPA
ncbi:hypothetical protein PS645_01471 [Pseudomonas fluorescens]|uniref:Uncharacterized protein n=1 Tax=Pseudomonas fluorescens TaxID=294 RepID=A0A5E6R9M3_PSEFL|nr:hypothetical protein [Pseudomonas fluorescens]VVM64976.1 hypothetical protein PS645_01471 [Pseudomonas fluorescens]